MIQSPEGLIYLESIARKLGMEEAPLSLDNLPDTLQSRQIGPLAGSEYKEVLAGIRTPEIPSLICIEREDNGEYLAYIDMGGVKTQIPNEVKEEDWNRFRLIGPIYPRVREGCFGFDAWREIIVNPSFKLAVHASSYGCSVLLRTTETSLHTLPSEEVLMETFQTIQAKADTQNRQIIGKMTKVLPRSRRSKETINIVLNDTEEEVFFGSPYNSYIPNLQLTYLLALQGGLALYRSHINYTRLARVTGFELSNEISELIANYERASVIRANRLSSFKESI